MNVLSSVTLRWETLMLRWRTASRRIRRKVREEVADTPYAATRLLGSVVLKRLMTRQPSEWTGLQELLRVAIGDLPLPVGEHDRAGVLSAQPVLGECIEPEQPVGLHRTRT